MRDLFSSVSAACLFGCLAAGLGPLSTPSHAQPQDDVSGDQLSTGLEEVVVTARRREERLQDTPISISAFTSGDLENRNIGRLDEIAQAAPNIVIKSAGPINPSSAAASFFIRGIGQADFLHNTDPGVGVYVDGVYVARSIGGLLDLLDIERLEVLRGPQGTLFGKNTIGGAINITTKKPSDEFSGKVSFTTGSFRRFDTSGSVNIPISKKVFAYISANYQRRDPYVENLLPGGTGSGGIDAFVGRGALRIEATERFTIDLAFDGTMRRETPAPFVLDAYYPGALLLTAGAGAAFTDQFLAGPYAMYSTYSTSGSGLAEQLLGFKLGPISDTDVLGGNITLFYDLGKFSLKSISAIRNVQSRAAGDSDKSPFHVFTNFFDWNDTFYSQELQFAVETDRLNWLIGAFYSYERGSMKDLISTPLFGVFSGGRTSVESLAFFSQGTYEITEWLNATAGVRWTEDDKKFHPDQYFYESVLPPFPVGTRVLPNVEVNRSFVQVTPYASISVKPSEETMLYASFSEGYKSGGFGQRIFPPIPVIPSFAPEKARVYEVGAKTMFFDNRLRTNLALFYTDYKDLQVSVLAAGNLVQTTANAAAAIVKGFEFELVAMPTKEFQIQANVGYTDAAYDKLDAEALASGLRLHHKFVNTPEWTISAAASYEFPLGDLGTITPRVDWSYVTEVENSALNEPIHHQSAYSLVNLSLTFRDRSELWEIMAAGRNVTDKAYLLAGRTNLTQGISENAYGRPAEWSLTVRRRF